MNTPLFSVLLFISSLTSASDLPYFHMEADAIDGHGIGDVKYILLAGYQGKYTPVEMMVPRSAWGGKSPRLDTLPNEYREKAMAEAFEKWKAQYRVNGIVPMQPKK